MRPLLTIVRDPDGEVDRHRLRTGAGPDGRCLVVRMTPDGRKRNIDWIARDLLKALGKDGHKSGKARNAQRRFDQATAWSIGHAVAHVIVVDAERLDGFRWRRLLDLALLSDAHLWLIVSSLATPRALRKFLGQWPHVTQDWAVFADRMDAILARAAREAEGEPVAAHTESAPHDEFPTFLHSAKELVDREASKRLDAVYRTACRATAGWLEALDKPVAEQDLAGHLRALLESNDTVVEALATIRAIQACMLKVDFLLKVDFNRFVLAAVDTRVGLTEDHAKRLNQYATTRYAAIPALLLLTREPSTRLADLAVGEVAPDGSSATIGGTSVGVPPHGRPILRAQLAARLLEGAAADSPFLIDSGGGRINSKVVTKVAKRVAVETGIKLYGHWTSHVDAPRWTHRNGLSLQSLRMN
jgi:hypothetical protein